jgi:hypothetical protein
MTNIGSYSGVKIPPGCEVFQKRDYYEILSPHTGEIIKRKNIAICSFNGLSVPINFEVYACSSYFKVVNLDNGEVTKMGDDELNDFLRKHENDGMVNIELMDNEIFILNDNKTKDNKPKDNEPKDNEPKDNKTKDNKPNDNEPKDNEPKDNKPKDKESEMCQCGSIVLKKNKERHLSSQKHKLWLFEKHFPENAGN